MKETKPTSWQHNQRGRCAFLSNYDAKNESPSLFIITLT